MKIERLFIYCLLAGTSFFASCSNEEMTDSQVEALPEGMYPLTFTATQGEVMATPQSRVSENSDGKSSKWDGDEVIKVQIGNGTAGTYTLNADGTIKTANTPAYWQSNKEGQTITAWYPASAASNYLKNQSSALPYVLKATATANFNTTPTLPFAHKLAKFRFKLSGTAITQSVTPTVTVKGIANTIYTNGEISAASTTAEEITPHQAGDYYEVLLLPGQVVDNFIKITVPAIGTYYYTPKSTSTSTVNLTLAEASCYTYDITVDKPGPTVIQGGDNITDSGDYIIKGGYTETITISGGSPKITLQDASISISDSNNPAINITGGSPELIIKGKNNTLSSSQWGGITLSGGASLTITGDGRESSKLTVTAGDNQWDGATTVGIGAGQHNTCGDITIQDVTLTVTGRNAAPTGAAAIGTSREGNENSTSKCGNITITNAMVDATSGAGAAAIGTGGVAYGDTTNKLICGDIHITESSNIIITLNSKNNNYGAGIGTGCLSTHQTECGKIILDPSSADKLETFTYGWKLNGTGTASYKIGKGTSSNGSNVTFGGIYLNGQDKVQSYADGWGSW